MPEPIRTFIAIELDDALRRALANIQAQLQRDRAARLVRWVEPASIHLTLKFLGDVESERLPTLERAIADACAASPPFSLALTGLGAFPNNRRPNVIWVGARGQVGVAVQLAQRIDAACLALGFVPEERPFAPHLTLGRVKRDASISERQLIGAMIDATRVETCGELKIDHVSVMKSELRPSGSVYTRLAAIALTERQS